MPNDSNDNVSPVRVRRLQERVPREYGRDGVPRQYAERGSKPSKPANITQPNPVPVPPPPGTVPTQPEKE
jgi:hypothetical protein